MSKKNIVFVLIAVFTTILTIIYAAAIRSGEIQTTPDITAEETSENIAKEDSENNTEKDSEEIVSTDDSYPYNPDRDNLDCTDSEAIKSRHTDNTDNHEYKTTDFSGVVWIGDSLSQGSLGDNNFNKNNPQAPWRVLGDISGWEVWGAGFYGYNTSDILWAYSEYNGIRDPGYIYVFWVGSNDFRESPDNVDSVIEQTDSFITNNSIDKYLILGTTNRGDMDPNAYIGINRRLSERYGDRYLDIMPYVKYGYDGVHLTEDSYAAIAEAVYQKLTQLYDK